MAVDRNRYNALKAKQYAKYGEGLRTGLDSHKGGTFESANRRIRQYKDQAKIESAAGEDTSRNLSQRLAASARRIAKDYSTRGNDYQYGTKAEVQAQHNARYRNIRAAFGMSAG